MKEVYFIGIGGIGMSAIARFFKRKGYKVSGYDRTPSPLTAELEAEGIEVHYEDAPHLMPSDKTALIVYTPAIPSDLKEFIKANSYGYDKVLKRSQVLGELTAGHRTLAVAGTHGKTSTSTLVAHILEHSGLGCSAFLGGVSRNYGTNFLLSENDTVVVEADEFDRSFLRLHPQISAITAMDADHLDIYGDLEHVQQAYRQYAAQVSEAVVAKLGLELHAEDLTAHLYSYHLESSNADFYASNIRLQSDGHYIYDLMHPNGCIKDIYVGVPGLLNVENSIAAAAICLLDEVEPEAIKAGIGSFKGVKRRLEEHINRKGLCYLDDYAHHPAEIEASLKSVRAMFPSRKLSVVFQPHLYTRTRDFASEFARALSLADELFLLDIYPAREEAIPGVTSELIFKDVNCSLKEMVAYNDLVALLKTKELDVLVSMGAGNIDRLVEEIKTALD